LNKISTVTLVCPRFLESVFTSHVNDVIILPTKAMPPHDWPHGSATQSTT
jgi:hypothetical protein